MATTDPYVQQTRTDTLSVVVAVRDIVLAQGSDTIAGVVNVPDDRDLVVYADKVTIQGALRFRRKPSNAEGSPETATGTDGGPGADGCSVLILAREIDTIPGKGADQQPAIDVSGEAGKTSDRYWTTAAATGAPADPADEGDCFNPASGAGYDPTQADDGESATTLENGAPDPDCPMNGKKGANGGAGGKGGAISIRCAHFATTASLSLNADGGDGGKGLPGQDGGVGGVGGKGNAGGTPCFVYDEAYGTSVAGQICAVGGGNGGTGGFGGDGGDAGLGGAPGTIVARLLECTASPYIDPKRQIQAGGGPSTGAAPGRPGDGGEAGWNPPLADWASPTKGAQGGKGNDGKVWPQATPAAINISEMCTIQELTDGLTQPLTGFLMMLFERVRADLLIAATSQQALAADGLNQRISWLATLLKAYTPQDPAEFPTLDGLRGHAQTLGTRAQAGLDYYGHSQPYAPLGSIDFHRDAFTKARKLLTDAQTEYNALHDALTAGTATLQQLGQARQALLDEKARYDAAIEPLRDTVLDLLNRINDTDQALIAQRNGVVDNDDGSLKSAISKACGLDRPDGSLDMSEFLECLSQFAFFGEQGPQRAAMVIGQVGKLIDTGVNKCVEADGTKVDKTYLINRLAQVDDLSKALTGYDQKQGTVAGIQLKDPGMVKLLGIQKQLDDFLDKVWNYQPAQTLRKDFQAYVDAVQARNADIFSLNQNLSLLHGYLAGSQQAAAATSQKTNEMAVLSMPGAPTMLAQLDRIVNSMQAECIRQLYLASRAYWFWSLDPDDQLSQILSKLSAGDTLALTDIVLNDADTQLYLNRTTEIEKLLSDPGGWLPARDSTLDARGFIVTFDDTSHPREFAMLKTKGTAIFRVARARQQTTADDSAFAGWADIRLRRVRAWIYGTKTSNDMLQLEIEHLGNETVVSRANYSAVVQHDTVTIPFRYDCKPGVPSSSCLSSTREVTVDGDIAFTDDHAAMPGLIGPFASWRITVRAKDNLALDLNAVHRLDMEFFVHARLFTGRSTPEPA